MRSIRLLAATTVILAAAWSCGGDGGGTGPNTPVANFTFAACTVGTPCQFTNTSTPAGLTYEWDFGDASPKVPDQSPVHTFTTPGDKNVSLKVTNSSGATNTKTSAVPVAAGTNQAPVASFDQPSPACIAGTPCGFHSTSTDADGTITTWAWNFGDNGTANTADATHTFAAAGPVTVTLTVTDDKGGTNTATQQITVAQAASQGCVTGTQGTVRVVNCTVAITTPGKVKITLLSRNCELGGNKVTARIPPQTAIVQTVFDNLCFRTEGESYIVKDASGADMVFQAGSQLLIQFRQGTPGPNDPSTGDPGIKVQGSFPNLQLNIDDGGAAQQQGEPDFNDAVLLVQQG
jgi:PKD repeat protein